MQKQFDSNYLFTCPSVSKRMPKNTYSSAFYYSPSRLADTLDQLFLSKYVTQLTHMLHDDHAVLVEQALAAREKTISGEMIVVMGL